MRISDHGFWRLPLAKDGRGVKPSFGREDIGAMVGLTTETVSRIIAELRRQGLLRDRGANIQDMQPGAAATHCQW